MLRVELGRNRELVIEWIAYHKLQGVQHFYLMSNGDTEALRILLAPYVQEGTVEIIDWYFNRRCWTHQAPQTNACIYRYLGLARWVAMMDIDEFFSVPSNTETVRSLVEKLDGNVGAFCGSMYWFRNLSDYPKMQPSFRHLVTEDFVDRFTIDMWRRRKCLFRPENVNIVRVHEHCGGLPAEARAVSLDKLRVNHYKMSGNVERYLELYRNTRWNLTKDEPTGIAALNASIRNEIIRMYPAGVPCQEQAAAAERARIASWPLARARARAGRRATFGPQLPTPTARLRERKRFFSGRPGHSEDCPLPESTQTATRANCHKHTYIQVCRTSSTR